jgi:Phosphotransferase enzyme family
VSGTTLADRARRETFALREAATALGWRVRSARPVALGRTGVHRVEIAPSRGAGSLPRGSGTVAAKVTSRLDSIMTPLAVHRLVVELHGAGAPVPGVLHPDPIATSAGLVAFWPWLDRALISAGEWGALTAAFHRAGRDFADRAGSYHPGTVLAARLATARRLATEPSHPLHDRRLLLAAVQDALDTAVPEALAAAAALPTVLALGDNQPGNVMRSGATLLVNDFERLAAAPAALDLAAVLLGVWHYGFPATALEEFREGYGPGAPTLEQVLPFARIRELSGLAVAMVNAADDPLMAEQMLVRASALDGPGRGGRWSFVGDPRDMSLADRPRAGITPTTNR